MILIKFLKSIVSLTLNKYKHIYSISILSHENPTCDLNIKSQFTNVIFGKYVKVFENNRIFNSKIDSYSYIQINGRIFNCEIGKFCSIAASVSIAPGIHDFTKVSTHPSLYQKSSPLPKVFANDDNIITSKNVTIGNDVWIGEKVVILDGVNIGNGAVIASGAVVNKDVAPYSIVGGVPAKHIKYRFDVPTIALLEKSEWWNYSDDWFEKKAYLMLDMDKFIDYLNATK